MKWRVAKQEGDLETQIRENSARQHECPTHGCLPTFFSAKARIRRRGLLRHESPCHESHRDKDFGLPSTGQALDEVVWRADRLAYRMAVPPAFQGRIGHFFRREQLAAPATSFLWARRTAESMATRSPDPLPERRNATARLPAPCRRSDRTMALQERTITWLEY